MSLSVGDRVPELTLRDQHGAQVSLSAVRSERAVLLVFFPYAFSGVCTGELHTLRDRLTEIEKAGATVLAVSCDPMYSLRVFADRDGLTFPLLSDFWPHGAVASAYGVLDEQRGCPSRSTFLVARDGVLTWSVHHPMGQARDVDEYLAAITEIGDSAVRK